MRIEEGRNLKYVIAVLLGAGIAFVPLGSGSSTETIPKIARIILSLHSINELL